LEFIQQNLLLVVLAVTSGVMLVATGFLRGGGKPVSTSEATQLINREDAQVIDVRDVAEFAAGHLPGARNLQTAKFAEQTADLDKMKGKPVIVCCESGVRSAKAAKELEKLGFDRVFNLDGGVAAWRKAGLPLSTKGGRK